VKARNYSNIRLLLLLFYRFHIEYRRVTSLLLFGYWFVHFGGFSSLVFFLLINPVRLHCGHLEYLEYSLLVYYFLGVFFSNTYHNIERKERP
jgi:hypothetical protein